MPDKDDLLADAVRAHREYEEGVERLKNARRVAFRRALTGPVKATEIAGAIGLSSGQVGRIARGDRR